MSACANGCTIRGQHVTECADECRHQMSDRPCSPSCDGTCRGCLPRPAEFGRLCPWCWQRLNADVVDAPSLARYLWAIAHAGPTLSSAEPIGRAGDPAERSILSGALDAFDGLHATLASWAHLILEEHPHGAQMLGPDESDARFTRTTKRLDRARFPHLEDEPDVWIRPPEVAGARSPEATSRLVRWLLPLLPWCAEQDWVAEMRRELADVVRTTAARYPVAERTRAVPGVACPVCGRLSLVFDPPTPERHSAQVNCSTRGCGVVYSQEDFNRLTRIVEWEHEQGERMGA